MGARRGHRARLLPQPVLRRGSAVRRLIHPGMSTRAVMNAVGQPYTRLGRTFGFCARTVDDPEVRMVVELTPSGRVTGVTTRQNG